MNKLVRACQEVKSPMRHLVSPGVINSPHIMFAPAVKHPSGIVPLGVPHSLDHFPVPADEDYDPLSRILSSEPCLNVCTEESQEEPWNPFALLNSPVAGPSGLGKRRLRMPSKQIKKKCMEPKIWCACTNKCMTLGCLCKGDKVKFGLKHIFKICQD